MPEHYFGFIGLGRESLRYIVALSAVCSSLFIVIALWDGFRLRPKTYGLTPLAIATFVAQCLVSIVGPSTSQSYLWSHNTASNYLQFGVPLMLLAIIFWQYLRYGPRQHPLVPNVTDRFHVLAWVALVVSFAVSWTFVVYHQDFFVNELQPTLNLIASVSLLAAVFVREDIRGLSVPGAWFYFAGNLLLYASMWAGEMSDPYPMAQHGYTYIYWIWMMIFAFNIAYAVLLRQRKRSGAILKLPAFANVA